MNRQATARIGPISTMVNDLKNTILIGLTVLTLGVAAWWLQPQTSTAQQYVDTQAQPVPADPDDVVEDEPSNDLATNRPQAQQPRPKPPSLHELLGFNAAQARLGRAVPTGEGITVGHVEIGVGNYLPNINSPQFKGVTFVERSGASKISSHAFATAREIYGRSGLAPGVSVVHCFEAHDWMGQGYLNASSPDPPVGGPMRVLTHSWVSDPPNAVDVLRRVDWQIDNYDTIMCVGINNGTQTPVPYLLGTAYNVIAVGTARPGPSGGSSGGYTRIEVAGRCKPDIVGLRKLTSFTTPDVAACVARLLQAADEMTDVAHLANKAEVIKAVLLAGAVKRRDWQPEPGKPLDEHLGAGIVNFDKSLQILQAGTPIITTAQTDDAESEEVAADEVVHLPNRMGWVFREIEPNQTHAYTFRLQAPMDEASIILNWHRRIGSLMTDDNSETGGSPAIWYGIPRLADLDLYLYHTDETGEEHELAVSASRVDNVEHIYLKRLEPGRYRLEVRRSEAVHEEPWDYALAWRVEVRNNRVVGE